MRFSKASSDASGSGWDGSESEGGVSGSVARAVKEREGLWKWVLREDEEIGNGFGSERDGDGMVAISEPSCLLSQFLVLDNASMPSSSMLYFGPCNILH